MTFGERISAIRNEKKLQQKDVANNVGIGPVILSRYENNLIIPSVIVAGKIAKALGTSLDYLVFGTEEEKSSAGSVGIKLQQFEKLSQEDQDHLLAVIEAFTAKAKLLAILGK